MNNQFTYTIPWRSRGYHAGNHASIQRGMGMEYRGITNLLAYPDPRRIALKQTLSDPLEQVHVRVFNQKSAVPVYAIADVSGSMFFGQQKTKVQLLCEIAKSIATSSIQNNDSFGLVPFSDEIQEPLLITRCIKLPLALEAITLLERYPVLSSNNNGLSNVHLYLPRERSLIFFISDFHFPLTQLKEILLLTGRHLLIPIVLWSEDEYQNLPPFGIINVQDAETQKKRVLFLRQKTRNSIYQHFIDRKESLNNLFLQFNRRAFFIQDNTWSPQKMSEYFLQR